MPRGINTLLNEYPWDEYPWDECPWDKNFWDESLLDETPWMKKKICLTAIQCGFGVYNNKIIDF